MKFSVFQQNRIIYRNVTQGKPLYRSPNGSGNKTVKLLPLGTVDDLMHYCTRPRAIMYQVVHSTSVVGDSLLIVTPVVGFCSCSMFQFALFYARSSFALVLMGKIES